ncbi:hypothetical protein DV735_g5810, partial [Chaetothyriales sp. CBS 134920]
MHLSPITLLFAAPALSFVVFPEAQVFLELPVASQSDSVSPRPGRPTSDDYDAYADPLPVVIWHGLGDSADAAGLKEIAELINEIHEGTYVHIISLGASEGAPDRQQSFFGNVSQQIDQVCDQLARDPILRTAPAIDAIGFSQGGQFLRGYIERCGHWAPRVRNLITFGSQHNGIAEFQKCESPTDWLCQGANSLLKASTVWSNFVQSRLVPAQYYRNLNDYDNYLAHSNFLADINNEREVKNPQYAANLAAIDDFIMIVFAEDQTVVPRESSWFFDVNVTKDEDGNEQRQVIPLLDLDIYKQDWIGLKELRQKNGLHFYKLQGGHMDLKTKDLEAIFRGHLGPLLKKRGARIDYQANRDNIVDHCLGTEYNLIPLPSLNAAFASPQLYWAKPLPEPDLRALVDNSLCFALYSPDSNSGAEHKKGDEGTATTATATTAAITSTRVLIGFARLVTDHVTLSYLTDVYVLPAWQGRGLGRWLVACVQEVTGLVGWYERMMKMRAVTGTEAYTVLEWKGPGNVF